MNSKSGTSSTVVKEVLSAKEICSIIRAGASSRVKVLRYLGLEIQYSSDDVSVVTPSTFTGPLVPVSQETFEQNAHAAKKERLDLMMIEDPAEYERLLASGELEDDEQKEENR